MLRSTPQMEMGVSMISRCLAGIGALLTLSALSVQALAQNIVYYPVLETRITSGVEIGVERQGTLHEVVKSTRRSSSTSTGSVTTHTTDLRVRNVDQSRTRTTNPNRRSSRPAGSSILSGITRAVGGDYGGLLELGGSFLDHMVEPKYSVAVSDSTLTQNHLTTRNIQDEGVSWEDSSSFEQNITQTMTSDLAKGYIRLSASLTNISERSVTLRQPTFVIHFVREGGDPYYVGQLPAHRSGLGTTIPSGGSATFEIILKDLDFITLTRQYRESTGVAVSVQDTHVRNAAGEFEPLAETWDRLHTGWVRIDLFDGRNRSIRYAQVPAAGVTLNDVLALGLPDRNVTLTEGADDFFSGYIRDINGVRSDSRTLTELPLLERPRWRRWFITVADSMGSVFRPEANHRIFPGYSVQIGYYAADQILPRDVYKPVVYETSNLELRPNTPISIPLDLNQGDIVEFSELQIIGFEIQVASLRKDPLPFPEYCPSTGSYEVSLVHGMTSPAVQWSNEQQCVSVSPESASLVAFQPSDLFYASGNLVAIDPQVAELFLAIQTLAYLRSSFFNGSDLAVIESTSRILPPRMRRSEFEQSMHILGLRIASVGGVSPALNVYAATEMPLMFVVERNVPTYESNWLFYTPRRVIRQMLLQVNGRTFEDHVVAEYLSNGISFAPTIICPEEQPEWMCMFAFAPLHHALPNPLYGARLRGVSGAPTRTYYPTAINDSSDTVTLPPTFGSRIAATLRVYRYTE
jgi:hypothetical protein